MTTRVVRMRGKTGSVRVLPSLQLVPLVVLLVVAAVAAAAPKVESSSRAELKDVEPFNNVLDYVSDDETMTGGSGDGSGVEDEVNDSDSSEETHKHGSAATGDVADAGLAGVEDMAIEEPSAEDALQPPEKPSVVEGPVAPILLRSRLNRTAELPRTTAEGDEGTHLPHGDDKDTGAGAPDGGSSSPRTLVLQRTDPEDSALTFAGANSFVEADLPHFAVCPEYHLSLKFRTDLPHGLLAFILQPAAPEAPRVHQYVYLKNGAVAVRSVVGSQRHTFITKPGGLPDGEWHDLLVGVSCRDGSVSVTVDGGEEHIFKDPSLVDPALPHDGGAARLFAGGYAPLLDTDPHPLLNVKSFRGCIRNLQLQRPAASPPEVTDGDHETWLGDGETAVTMEVTRHNDVTSGLTCIDKCLISNPCPEKSRCINHFSHASCDCTELETLGKHCAKQDAAVLTLHGDGYLSHRLYHWRDRIHKKAFKVAFHFKTNTSDSVLFLTRSLDHKGHVSLSLDVWGQLRLGSPCPKLIPNIQVILDGVPQDTEALTSRHEGSEGNVSLPPPLSDSQWHHVVLSYNAHDGKHLLDLDPRVYFGYSPALNEVCYQPKVTGDLRCAQNKETNKGHRFYFDSKHGGCVNMDYSGCGGNDNNFGSAEECQAQCYEPGLASYEPFTGCFKRVYVDGVNLLEDLQEDPGKNDRTVYTGQRSGDSSKCQEDSTQAISITTVRSHVTLPGPTEPQESLTLQLDLKIKSQTEVNQGVIAKGVAVMADSLDEWMVYSDGTHVFFKLQNEVLAFRSEGKLEKEWNTLTLEAKTHTVTLILNGSPSTEESPLPLTYLSGVTLGADIAALQGCIRNLRVGDYSPDLRELVNTRRGVVFDGCQVLCPCSSSSRGCQNGGRCSLTSSGTVSCDCAGTGHLGNRCQFAEYPRSCEGYRRHGFNTSGRYQIDVDGEGPTPSFGVQCSFSDDYTVTELHHDVPDKFVVRKAGLSTYRVAVGYSGLSSEQLIAMVSYSTSCSQNISFECASAPLHLSSETWFTSPQMKLNSHFGTDTPGICPCKEKNECGLPTVVCNCDIIDGLRRRDSGTITDPRQLPVTGLSVIMNKDKTTKKTKATMTLGSLVCQKQVPPDDSVTLLESSSFLELPTPAQPVSIGLAFRTSATSATILHKPAHHRQQADYRLLLQSANKLEFQYVLGDVRYTVTFHTKYLLNVAAWQHVWVDFDSQEIRVVLNGLPKYINLENVDEVSEGDFYIGGTPSDLHGSLHKPPSTPGLIGCLKDLTFNGESVSLRRLLRHAPTLTYNIGCSLSCDPNPCHNGAICVEKPAGQYECECLNSYAEWGRNCQNSLNYNSVTILNADTEMRYSNESTLPANEFNPLRQDVTFSFKTREVQGLIMFAKDHVQNLIQMYLSEPNQLTVMWNTGYTLRKMSVNTKNIALNQGQLVQVFLNRSRVSTDLHVMTRGRLFQVTEAVGLELLDKSQYQQYPYGKVIPDTELTLYEQPSLLPAPRLKVHFGGAMTGGVRAKIPGFVGCIGGLKVGSHQIKLDDRAIWSWNQLSYEIGCFSSCSTGNKCLNSGVCMDVFDEGNRRTSQCECSDTSYVGDRCDQEVAYHFSGKDALIFHKHYAVFQEAFILDFAFAVTHEEDSEEDETVTETLLILRDAPARSEESSFSASPPRGLIAVGIQKSSVLSVMHRTSPSHNWALAIKDVDLRDLNVTDGARYHVVMRVAQDWDTNLEVRRLTSVEVNGVSLPTKSQLINLSRYKEFSKPSLVVGGNGDQAPTGEPMDAWTHFRGCISNVQMRTQSLKVYRPLEEFAEGSVSQDSAREGLPGRATCASFADKGARAVGHHREPYLRAAPVPATEPSREPLQPLERKAPPENDGSTMRQVGIIAGLIVGGVVLAVFVYVCKISNNKRRGQYGAVPDAAPDAVPGAVPAQQEDEGRTGSVSSSSSSCSKSSVNSANKKDPLLENSIEMIEMKAPNNSAASETTSVEYVKETPSAESQNVKVQNEEHQNDEKEEVTVDSEKIEDSEIPDDQDGTEAAVVTNEVASEEVTPEVTITIDYAPDQPGSDDSDAEPSPNADPNADVIAKLGNNDLETSYTKLSESFEEIAGAAIDSSSISKSSSTSSFSDIENTAEGTAAPADDQESEKAKRISKKKSRRSASYEVRGPDGTSDPATDDLQEPAHEEGEEDNASGKERREPKVVSAQELESMDREEGPGVEIIDAQKYYISRKTSGSPNIPPKKDKQ